MAATRGSDLGNGHAQEGHGDRRVDDRARDRELPPSVVRVTYQNVAYELVLHPSLALADVAACLAAAFALDARDVVALRHAARRTFFPLSLVARSPQSFADGVYELVVGETSHQAHGDDEQAADGDGDGEEDVRAEAPETPQSRERHRKKTRRGRRNRGKRNDGDLVSTSTPTLADDRDGDGNVEAPLRRSSIGVEASETPQRTASDAGTSDDEEAESIPELDLTDFELSQLVHVFTQACPQGHLDRATFEHCLEKILSQSGRYDPLARDMFVRLFDIFDRQQRHSVNVATFLGGLSVFTNGERDDKIRIIFDVFDSDQDGFISIEEMTQYLQAVFFVLAETSPELFLHQKVDPKELAETTAQQCFREAILNEEGMLSFESFQEWYSRPGSSQLVAAASKKQTRQQSANDIQAFTKIREMIGLSDLSAEDLFSTLSALSTEDCTSLTKEQFINGFFAVVKKQNKQPTRELVPLLDRLYHAFDTDGNGMVDFVELSTGLSIFCGGSQDDKVVAAFSLFDSDGDGFITRDEMEKYLASVFRILFETNPTLAQTMGIDAKKLALYTTIQAFEDADLNRDGKLSLDEFRRWYVSSATSHLTQPPTHSVPSAASIPPSLLLPELPELRKSFPLSAMSSMESVAAVASLRNRAPDEVFELLAAKVNQEGMLSRDAVHTVFAELVEKASTESSVDPRIKNHREVQELIDTIFDAFDVDKDGFVDFCELSSGLSVYCRGSQFDKIKAAFTLFDVNHDGFISQVEMETYLTSVFRIVYATLRRAGEFAGGVSPEELARATTQDAFAHFDANHDGRLSLAEFAKWCSSRQDPTSPHPFAAPPHVAPPMSESPPSLVRASHNALREMQMMTNLIAYDVNDVFEFFKACSDTNGNVSKPAFFRCFHKLLSDKHGALTPEMQARSRSLIRELFDVFDTDGNGTIDVQELGAGLSVLCGGNSSDRAQSLFTLYDVNHDGFVSPAEMQAYSTAVFRVLFKANPDLAETMNMTPEQLAEATTIECFNSFDHDGNGKLSLDEFKEWVERQKTATIGATLGVDVTSAISIEDAKRLTGLGRVPLERLAEVFVSAADESGRVSRADFDECLDGLQHDDHDGETERKREVVDRVFGAFDTDGTGYAVFDDLTSGLSILCGGSRDDKIETTFGLYDTNGDGFISFAELAHYLTSVFQLMYALDPAYKTRLRVSPQDLAMFSATDIFSQVDANKDGRLDLEEFKRWYSPPPQPSLDINEVRRLTNLGNLDVVDVFERFAVQAGKDGTLGRDAFNKCFQEIFAAESATRTEQEALRAQQIIDRIFDVFDEDHNGRIDFSELASGLSVLCRGAREDKVKAAFRLYDFNGDGFISLDEMTRYLTSFFRVLYVVQPKMAEEMGVSPEELGAVTAEQAFVEADSNHDGKLSYDEFLIWYNSPEEVEDGDSAAKHAVQDSSKWGLSLGEIKKLTNLDLFAPDEVFEIFAAEADKEGRLSRGAFNTSFKKVLRAEPLKEAPVLLNEEEKAKQEQVVDALFELFDTDHSGSVEFGELASGLSILCGGTKDQRMRAAFALFDFNGDGFISREEMSRYLTSVFRVLYQVSPETQKLGVTPEELGTATAQRAFAEADQDLDGRLTFEEFEKWYERSGGIGNFAKSNESLFCLGEARRLVNLDSFTPTEIFEALADCSDDRGYVARDAFEKVFRALIASKPRETRKSVDPSEHVTAILDRLFDLFDEDKQGLADFSDMSSGLSILCGGKPSEKVKAAFSLYDYNGDGYISLDEMTRYLTAVFKVLKDVSPSVDLQKDVSVEAFAQRTALQAFGEADANHDGRLSFDEFRNWYLNSPTSNIERLMEKSIPEWVSLQEVRRLTNLGAFTPSQVVATFMRFVSADKTLDRGAFHRALIALRASTNDPAGDDRLRLLVDRMFALFDTNHDGVVDLNELMSGMSILCGGSETDKVRAAFNLYDVDHDGFISLAEMKLYLTSVFKVLFEVNPETEAYMGVLPEDLAAITAERAFAEADLDHDGRLSFEEFSKWYKQPADDAERSAVPDWVSLELVKEITRLEQHSPNAVFEVLASHCAEDGTISRDAFEDCFEQLVDEDFRRDDEQLDRLRLILDRLFTIFDTDGNGVVDYCELSSGLSVLCGGSREDKIRSAFALFDVNHDGFISLEEMVRYLGSMFKVLFETNPETKDKLGVEPLELAAITAEQCFLEADLNHDGRLSLDEFVRWYSRSEGLEGASAGASRPQVQPQVAARPPPQANGNGKAVGNHKAKRAAPKQAISSASVEEFFATTKALALARGENAAHLMAASALSMNSASMKRARKLLKLDTYEVGDVFEIFAEAAPAGELSYASFRKCFDQIVKLAGGHDTAEEKREAEQMIRRLFLIFDSDRSNTVDFGELASGLSVLSGSSMDEKVKAAFQLYDVNGDGFIGLNEMINYMTAIFKVMYETSGGSSSSKMSAEAEELARVTATQCFQEADLDRDGRLSFEEFKEWCCGV